MDVRIPIIEKRLATVERIVGVTGGKGGIGKSSVASLLALSLSSRGRNVGLLDLDLSSPSTHFILGINDAKIEEEKGIVPPHVDGIRFMSFALFAEEGAVPLRGYDISNAIVEILSTTIWGELDFLVLDLPPGTSDAILDVVRLVRRIEFIVVLTPSRLASHAVRRHVELLKEYGLPILCLIENLSGGKESANQETCTCTQRFFSIPYDKGFEAALGDRRRLRRTAFFEAIEGVTSLLTGPRSLEEHF